MYDRRVPSLRSLRLLAVAVLACPRPAFAACPVPTPPCESMRKADLVFYGEVVTATPPTHGDQKVTFRVLRPFKGVGDTRFTGAFRVTGQGVYLRGRGAPGCLRFRARQRPVVDELRPHRPGVPTR